jgi:mRNA interferase MazF
MPISGTVERGSIVWIKLHPGTGHEQDGYRPALVLSDGIIDPSSPNKFAMVVPVTNTARGYAFEVSVPSGIAISGTYVSDPELTGVVQTDQAKSLDLDARNAEVIGKVDPESEFYKHVVTNVRSILA